LTAPKRTVASPLDLQHRPHIERPNYVNPRVTALLLIAVAVGAAIGALIVGGGAAPEAR